ncbi:hypothetical protein M426DRAFT_147629 [Hypoxylon sp. CI-4A]|nr:hypothetical protein M426DRAFT_147629 [Hypoxylon sp. CI-4A]
MNLRMRRSFHILRRVCTAPRSSLSIPSRRFWSRPQLNFPYPGPYFYPPPKPRGGRLKYMAIGSALTIVAYLAHLLYDIRQLSQQLKQLQEEEEEEHSQRINLTLKFSQLFKEARRLDDEDLLRQMTFQYARGVAKDWTEIGPLPSLLQHEKRRGKDIIPEEDTLMFIDNSVPEDRIQLPVQIAINAEAEDIIRRMSSCTSFTFLSSPLIKPLKCLSQSHPKKHFRRPESL